jgi:enoyl-CoA hydratase/carnithine racemase
MNPQPFSASEREGILELWLDTPGSEVNVFTEQAALQLERLLAGVDPSEQRAVVFRTRKPGSFINGASLMLANSVQRPEDLPRMTAPIHNAYRAVRALGVPTIAAIQGNCYGCGLEFTLHARYRVAERSFETHFYMTEIADYLLVPTFGSTQNLPRLVGLGAATDLLLWGERWSADQAWANGLVDACFEPAQFETRLATFVAQVTEASTPFDLSETAGNDDDEVRIRTRERIQRLPPLYRELYSDCFDLLERAALAEPNDAAYALEAAACGRSIVRPIAKAAVSFFFIRQLAKARSCGSKPDAAPQRVAIEGMPELERLLSARRVRDIEIVPPDPSSNDVLHLVPPGGRIDGRRSIVVALRPILGPVELGSGVMAYAPLLAQGIEIVEIAAPRVCAEQSRAVALLSRAGFHVIASTVDSKLVLDALLQSYFGPLEAFIARRGNAADVGRTLREFGFVREPRQLAAALPARRHELLNGASEGGVFRQELLDALLVELLDFALRSLDERTLSHATLVDLAARELIDFPLGLTSLCRYLDTTRTREVLARAATFRDLVSDAALERTTRYSEGSRSFYR